MKNIISTLDIKLTNKCNYACDYCFAEPDQITDISYKLFDKSLLLAKALNVKFLEFCGGEPLLHPYFNDLVKRAKNKNLRLILRTNGIYINKHIQTIVKDFDWVGISLDGTEKINDKMRKSKNNITARDKFQIPINNIFELNKRNPKLKILLGTLISAINYDSVIKLQEYIIKNKLPINQWKFCFFHPRRHRAKKNSKRFKISKKDFGLLSEKIRVGYLKDKLGIQVLFHGGFTSRGDCLIVSPNGNLSVGSNSFLNISNLKINNIVSEINRNKERKQIVDNKKLTYY